MRASRLFVKGRQGFGPGSRLLLSALLLLSAASPDPVFSPRAVRAATRRPGPAPAPGRIRELVPDKYRKKYARWKAEYLSTEAGRRQWARYASDPDFTLTINVSPELGRGGLVSDYEWDDAGKLVAATITLGSGLDGGLLSPLYYPVTSALAAPDEERAAFSGDILAAAKLAHEFGHVNRAAETEAALYQRQSILAAVYAETFRESGYDAKDPRLAQLTRLMGGTPFEIKREREHTAEANALAFLRERMSGERGNVALFKKIRRSVKEYGQGHIRLPE